MRRVVAIAVIGGALIGVTSVACSQNAPGPYESGGRTLPPILIGDTCSGATPDGDECMTDEECCSGACNLEAIMPVCFTPPDASTTE
jgi:hypothetical protein